MIRHLISYSDRNNLYEMWFVPKGKTELDTGTQREEIVFHSKIRKDAMGDTKIVKFIVPNVSAYTPSSAE